MEYGIKELRERAKFFYKNKLKTFIVDKENNYYFCFIEEVDNIKIKINNFAGKRKGKEDLILIDIKEIKAYKTPSLPMETKGGIKI
jgi:hypothetical protein